MRSSVQNPTAVFSQGLGGLWGSPPEWKEKMMSDTRKITLRTRVRLAQLEFAAMRWESATMIALTIIATPATYLFAGILEHVGEVEAGELAALVGVEYLL